jgi:hypothetical protein
LLLRQQNKGDLVFKPNEVLEAPFDEISIPNAMVYGVRGVVDKIADHDEL